uniref:Uncharacterized protein n=1 Tax=Anguilla anguilla TaxID=7936 RepID=A0A0E9W1R6_ANGAN
MNSSKRLLYLILRSMVD